MTNYSPETIPHSRDDAREKPRYKLHVVGHDDAYLFTAGDPVDMSRIAVARSRHESEPCGSPEARRDFVATTLASLGVVQAELDLRSVELLHGIITGEITPSGKRVTDRELFEYGSQFEQE